MPGIAPPYALDAVVFHFPALASSAGRAPLGGDREMALGALAAARLVDALLPPFAINRESRLARAEHAKQWATSLSMPQPARMALLRTFDASASGVGESVEALTELSRTLTGHLEPHAQQELADLIVRLRKYAPGQPGL